MTEVTFAAKFLPLSPRTNLTPSSTAISISASLAVSSCQSGCRVKGEYYNEEDLNLSANWKNPVEREKLKTVESYQKGHFWILLHCWWECKLVQPLWRTVWSFLKKTKNRTTIWLSNPTPGHILRENHDLKRYMHPDVHCNTIYNSQDMEAT